MSGNSYDLDVITWSPEGKLLQVEYATEATKQGSCCIGIRSQKFAVLVTTKKAVDDLSYLTSKMRLVSEQLGLTFSGITNDAKFLSRALFNVDAYYQYLYRRHASMHTMMNVYTSIAQTNTIRSDRRPFGVSLLLAGYDAYGPHIFETRPSGEVEEYEAFAIGRHSQSAKTYLEKNQSAFAECSLRDLKIHGIKALLKTTTEDGQTLTPEMLEICEPSLEGSPSVAVLKSDAHLTSKVTNLSSRKELE
uniref:Proteasome subunit alpha type-1-like n=1 Tax=Dermatophagoides pteronyssinus TaxID=6956 RepID=A0A6P6Y751_DERPT|nr:proteasome subunit alpha type-1-like [Dermatophagoides pteronyssinus]